MEEIQELLSILERTPELALWGLTIYFAFVLMKLASWVYAIKFVLELFIKRYFNVKEKELEQTTALRVISYFNNSKIGSMTENSLFRLLDAVKDEGRSYIHLSDIEEAIKAVRQSKKN